MSQIYCGSCRCCMPLLDVPWDTCSNQIYFEQENGLDDPFPSKIMTLEFNLSLVNIIEKMNKQKNPKNQNKAQTRNVLERASHTATVYFFFLLFVFNLLGFSIKNCKDEVVIVTNFARSHQMRILNLMKN